MPLGPGTSTFEALDHVRTPIERPTPLRKLRDLKIYFEAATMELRWIIDSIKSHRLVDFACMKHGVNVVEATRTLWNARRPLLDGSAKFERVKSAGLIRDNHLLPTLIHLRTRSTSTRPFSLFHD